MIKIRISEIQEGVSDSDTSNPETMDIPTEFSQEEEEPHQQEQEVPQPDIERQPQQEENQQVPELQHMEPGYEQMQQPQQKEIMEKVVGKLN